MSVTVPKLGFQQTEHLNRRHKAELWGFTFDIRLPAVMDAQWRLEVWADGFMLRQETFAYFMDAVEFAQNWLVHVHKGIMLGVDLKVED